MNIPPNAPVGSRDVNISNVLNNVNSLSINKFRGEADDFIGGGNQRTLAYSLLI